MAARRGLNKGRGLGSLIPQKIKSENEGNSEDRGMTEIEGAAASGNAESRTEKNTEKRKSRMDASNKGTKTGKNQKTAGGSKTSAKTAESGEAKIDSSKESSISLRLSQIIPNKDQPRKDFSEEAIAELADSIRQHGVLQPLLVQKSGKYYEIVAGERRWRAAKEAGLKDVPVIIRSFSEQEAMEISLIENIQREDLNAIEEAEAYKRLMDEFELTQEAVAEKVGKSRTTITNALRLLKLAGPVRHLLLNGSLTMGHARALLALEDEEEQIRAAHRVIQKKLSVRETEKMVRQILRPRKKTVKPEDDEQLRLALKELEERMGKHMGTKVSIQPRGEKGKIEIEYYSQEDLERILDIIG
uniref:ParB/RepB/Spo0J family partition protein n=1 Tax=Eubacterium cellulosolvens TaxID=29322 RepID=UPI000482C7AE|nr:ParB/RepB/Spo0J family partition protein [[Eubacterium] cellulosolvens]